MHVRSDRAPQYQDRAKGHLIVARCGVPTSSHSSPGQCFIGVQDPRRVIIVAWIARPSFNWCSCRSSSSARTSRPPCRRRSQATYDDAAAVLEEAKQIQAHLEAQDREFEKIMAALNTLKGGDERRHLLHPGNLWYHSPEFIRPSFSLMGKFCSSCEDWGR